MGPVGDGEDGTRPMRPYTSFLSATPERLIRWSERLLRCSLHLLRCSVRLLRCCGRCRSEVRPRSELATCYVLPTGEGKRRLRLRQVGAVAENPRELGTSLGPRTSDLGTLRGRTCMLVTGRLRVYARDWAAPRLCSKLGGLARMLAAARLRDWNTDWSADWSTLEHRLEHRLEPSADPSMRAELGGPCMRGAGRGRVCAELGGAVYARREKACFSMIFVDFQCFFCFF